MKIYTKTGDKGKTSLFTGKRVSKHHIRIESYGTVDELNAQLGLLRDQDMDAHSKEMLALIQERLFTLGSILATEPQKDKRLKIPRIEAADIELLEQEMDKINGELPEMTHFILPGGHPTVSYCHIARTVCRRAERAICRLDEKDAVPEAVLCYINRLSDYLFVLARKLSKDLKVQEIEWIPRKLES